MNSATECIKLGKAIKACIENGNRILEDAKYLFDFESYASAYVLAKLAREEFAKSFILKLVEEKSLNWTEEVRRSLNHHVSKQLMGIIFEHLNPNTNEFLKMLEERTLFKMPKKVSDAMNIYIHEVLMRWKSQNWVWVEDPEYDKEAKSVYKGKEDKLKQDAIYIKISKDGQVINSPAELKKENAASEIDKAERCFHLLKDESKDLKYMKVFKIFKLLK